MRMLLLLSLAAGLILVEPAESAPRLRVQAGNHDRVQTIVFLDWPGDWPKYDALRDENGHTLDLQIDAAGQACFVEPDLAAGTTKTYTLLSRNVPPDKTSWVTAQTEDTLVKITAPGLPALTYHTTPAPLPRPDIAAVYARGAYIHPIFSPSGRQVTDDYPPNHIHHHGIWFAWTKTKVGSLDPDFWNMGQSKGTVEFAALDAIWDGPLHGGWQSRHRHRELMSEQRQVILQESWTVRVYRTPADSFRYGLFDIKSRQVCASDQALHLPKYHYGGTGIRGLRQWDGREHTFFLTSEGITDRVAGNESRARWCYMGGMAEGGQTGIAIFCHPDNYRYPQPVRLHPTEPYFSFAPQQMGEMSIEPGHPYIMQYRHVVFDGPPEADRLERMFQDYAEPPQVLLLKD